MSWLKRHFLFSDNTHPGMVAGKVNFEQWYNPASFYHKADFQTWCDQLGA